MYVCIRSFTPLYLRLDKPAHLFRFCNIFASSQILTQPSDFLGFWEIFATFLTNFFRIWDTFASLPRRSGSSAGVLPHLYGISTTTCLQPQSILVADAHLANPMKERVINFIHRFFRRLVYTSTRRPQTYLLVYIISWNKC